MFAIAKEALRDELLWSLSIASSKKGESTSSTGVVKHIKLRFETI